MPTELCFEKWEGLGNDFVLVPPSDATSGGLDAATVRRLCDRHRGIGADGVLAVTRDADGAARMVVHNADGSRPEMCGNGLRCVAAYLTAAAGRDADDFAVRTDAGERRCRVTRAAESWWAEIDMGRARALGPIALPEAGARRFLRIDVGNPHAVSFGPFANADLDAIGAALERAVPGGINVELARLVAERRIDMVVWERGVGRTLACGTGACAVAAAAVVSGLVSAGSGIELELPGGRLVVSVSPGELALTLGGPARRVFQGVVDPCA